jgi:hypothetical protein
MALFRGKRRKVPQHSQIQSETTLKQVACGDWYLKQRRVS